MVDSSRAQLQHPVMRVAVVGGVVALVMALVGCGAGDGSDLSVEQSPDTTIGASTAGAAELTAADPLEFVATTLPADAYQYNESRTPSSGLPQLFRMYESARGPGGNQFTIHVARVTADGEAANFQTRVQGFPYEDGTSFKQLVVRGRPALLTETRGPIVTDRLLSWAEGTDTIIQVVSPFLDEAALLAIAQGVELRWSDGPPTHRTLDPQLCAQVRANPHDISDGLLAEAEKAMQALDPATYDRFVDSAERQAYIRSELNAQFEESLANSGC